MRHALIASWNARRWQAMNLLRRVWFALGGALPRRTRRRRRAAASGTPAATADLGCAVDIVILPIIEWDFRFQRPQQLASCLAAAGHRVFYLAQRFRARGPAFEIAEKRHNVFAVSLRGPARNVYTDTMDSAVCDALFASLNELRIATGLGATVLLVELPFWWPLAAMARRELAWPVVYDCMDLHSGFSTNRPAMLEQEQALLTGADLVVVSSEMLQREAAGRARRVEVIRNGCDFEHFSAVKGRRPGPRPVIGYVGAIADWFDADLVADLAERRPDWDFLLIGSTFTASDRRLRRLPNVTMPGEQPYDSLPSWIERFDVAIIPFRRVPLTEATNPVKAYELLASGKPVVAVPIPEVARLAPLVRLASTASEMEAEILAALAEDDPARAAARRAFAAANTWQQRTVQLASALDGCFPLASIIIVTFGGLEMTRACLTSIFSRTEWPNYEVVIVDNGSGDDMLEYLRTLAARHPNVRLVLNPGNHGFAAASNQGLAVAQGEVLVLLNNDTVVPHGWLSGLIRHLHRDPGIGAVGPVTNCIGNEAQVSVGYSSPAAMPQWAADWMRANADILTPIPVLAMFCLAMPRRTFEVVGGLDERFAVGMFEDDDYALRIAQAGLEMVCAEDVFVHHRGGAAFARLPRASYRALQAENRCRFEEKWGRPWTPHSYRHQRPDWGGASRRWNPPGSGEAGH